MHARGHVVVRQDAEVGREFWAHPVQVRRWTPYFWHAECIRELHVAQALAQREAAIVLPWAEGFEVAHFTDGTAQNV